MSDEKKTPVPAIGSTWIEYDRGGVVCVTGVRTSLVDGRTSVLFVILDETSGLIFGDGSVPLARWSQRMRPVVAATIRRQVVLARPELLPADVLALAEAIAEERMLREHAEMELVRMRANLDAVRANLDAALVRAENAEAER